MRKLVYALPLTALTSCTPLWEVRGTVTPAPPNALVTLACPSRGPSARGRGAVSASGQFRLFDSGFMSLECRIEISAPGFRTIELKVAPYCRQTFDQRFCHLAELTATLVPAATQ
jgi:hypothetical protein